MIISTIIALAAAKAISIPVSTFVMAITGSSLAGFSLGGLAMKLYHYFTQHPIDPHTAREIAALTLEREQCTTSTYRQAEALVAQSARDATQLRQILHQEQAQLTTANQALRHETETVGENNVLLRDVIHVLNQTSTIIGDSAQPVITELQRHLENITKTEADFAAVVALLQTRQQALKATIAQHRDLLHARKTNQSEEAEQLSALSKKLDWAINLITSMRQNRLYPSGSSQIDAKFSQLTQKAEETVTLLGEATRKIAELTLINRQLREKIKRQNSLVDDSACDKESELTQQVIKTNRGIRLFGTIS